ncbi:putative membrane protein [Acinetobacter calcoaceticus]|uniref:Putative membrane protein n=1 Tax=Acinetobacter calcoaceticus TaxID=471 RepID=A0A4R1XW26_ACICA|nr:putative membrane protein [Acinetobacter calcoaceticus]
MPKVHSEIRIMWLMFLMIVAIAAWFLELHLLSYLCALALVMSVMHYVDLIQNPTQDIATQFDAEHVRNSKVPLYLASLLAVLGAVMSWHWVLGAGITIWIFFFLRWLRRLEQQLNRLQHLLERQQQSSQQGLTPAATLSKSKTQSEAALRTEAECNSQAELKSGAVAEPESKFASESMPESASEFKSSLESAPFALQPQQGEVTITAADSVELSISTGSTQTNTPDLNMLDQVKSWLFQGNPVLKAAICILLIGIVLLLRFATEHWQIDLAMQLALLALLSTSVCGLGCRLFRKNPSFALGLQGLGMAGLFLSLFFAYYNQVIASFPLAAALYMCIMAATIGLSLKQNSIELALMAMLVAYFAPFSLPIRDMSSVELLTYYLLINIAIAILSSVRPWKVLVHIALLTSVVIGSGYALQHADFAQLPMLLLILAHTAIFIWLGFRYSQLIAKRDLQQFQLKPVLDIALIFGAPTVAYALVYLLYFESILWQASLSFAFAVVFAGLYALIKRKAHIDVIAQSYLSLSLIFLSIIPAILLPEQWSVVGWALQGVLVFAYALWRDLAIGRYLAMALLIIAGLSGAYYLLESDDLPRSVLWCLSLSYIVVVVLANSCERFRAQYDNLMAVFHAMLMFFAFAILLLLFADQFDLDEHPSLVLLLLSIGLFILNEIMQLLKATWTWFIPKCLAMLPILLYALWLLVTQMDQGQLIWVSNVDAWYFAASGILLFGLSLRTQMNYATVQEPISASALLSLSLASMVLWPAMPYMSLMILPLLFCAWGFFRRQDHKLVMIWQSNASLMLLLIWMICSQLFEQGAFDVYWLPVINPFDLVSLAALLAMIWLLSLQLKTRLDRGIIAILAVLSLLWLSSYILLRALHVYLETPYNQIELWGNAVVQLSLTLLWVSLAFITMTLAKRLKLRALWILGASLLVIVTFKLVLLDLSHIGTLLRVFSFLGAGLVMLIIAYIAPIPDLPSSDREDTVPK